MSAVAKYWKVLLAFILIVATVMIYLSGYQTKKTVYETERNRIQIMIASLENSIRENNRYAGIDAEQLEKENAKILASRLELYEKFPVEMKEEDQILYVLYLESLFGTEINFAFSTPQPIVALRDGATLQGLTLTVNYETTYQGFKDMVTYLATDSRITSVQYASIQYDAEKDTATGEITLLLYLIDTDLVEYLPPEVTNPDTGKDNIYE